VFAWHNGPHDADPFLFSSLFLGLQAGRSVLNLLTPIVFFFARYLFIFHPDPTAVWSHQYFFFLSASLSFRLNLSISSHSCASVPAAFLMHSG